MKQRPQKSTPQLSQLTLINSPVTFYPCDKNNVNTLICWILTILDYHK